MKTEAEIGPDSPLQALVRERLEFLGLNPFEAAKSVGLERSYINDILIGKKKSLRTDKIDDLARALQLAPQDLALAIAKPAANSTIAVMGYLGAGAEVEPDFEQVPPEGLEEVTLPFPLPEEMWAFKVKGTSMLPQYKPDTVIVVYREQRRAIETFYGEEAAVRTADGRRFIKTIIRGDRKGTVTLSSWNDNPIENVRLEWIGEVFATLPPGKPRRQHIGGIQGQLRLKAAS